MTLSLSMVVAINTECNRTIIAGSRLRLIVAIVTIVIICVKRTALRSRPW